jgi:hypothetical protein
MTSEIENSKILCRRKRGESEGSIIISGQAISLATAEPSYPGSFRLQCS